MLILKLDGIPPSKKNGMMIITVKGRPMVIPKKEYREWEASATMLLRSQCAALKMECYKDPVGVEIIFRCKGLRLWDLSNKAEGAMDALVKAGIIEDDNRFKVPKLVLQWDSDTVDSTEIHIYPMEKPL